MRAARTAQENAARHAETAASTPNPAAPVFRTISAEDQQRQKDAAEARQREEKVKGLIKASRVPPRYAPNEQTGRPGASLRGLGLVPAELRPAYRAVAEQLQTLLWRPRLIALVGDRGPGKTWLGCATALDFCRAGRSAVYLDALDYFIELKRTYRDNARQDESQIEDRYLKPQLLVLDEIQERGETAWEDRMLTRLANKRYAMDLATVLIANLSEDEFKAHVGSSVADRFHEDDGLVITCNWPSLRGRIINGKGG